MTPSFMTYLDWLSGETEKRSNRRRARRRTASKGSQRVARAKDLIAIANNLYVRSDLHRCIEVLKDVVCLTPKNPHPYFTLGLIFEEREEFTKAYYCFLIAAHLQKNNYGLWKKLYDYSRRLGYEKERIYFIEVLQRKSNQREMVMEKMSLYGENKFRELSCKIELFEFDGVDDGIFTMIHENISHKAKMGRLARRLSNYLMKNDGSCSDYYLEQLVILKYDASDFTDLKLILDKYFLGRHMKLSAKLRIIYVIASICDIKADKAINECYSDISILLRDDEIWCTLTEVEPVKHLVDVLIGRSMLDDAVGVLNRMKSVFEEHREFIYWKLGNIFKEKKSYDEALLCYDLVLRTNPINDVVKSQIHSIYVEQGNLEMARRYQTISQLVSIVDGLGGRSKDGNPYSTEMCMDMRVLYDNTRTLTGSGDSEEFMRSNGILVDDFLKNKFIFGKKRIRQHSSGKELQNLEIPSLPPADEHGQVTRMNGVEQRFRFFDMHGLDVDEWFNVVTNQIFSLLAADNVEEATSLVFKSLEAYIFKHRSDLMTKLVFVGLKTSLLFGEFNDFIILIRSLILHTGNYSYSYFLFYFCNFFLGFHKNNSFSSFQKYLQRVCRRKLMGCNEDFDNYSAEMSSSACDDEAYGGADTEPETMDYELKSEPIAADERSTGISRHKAIGVSHFLFLNSLIPNLLQSKTVEMISSVQTERSSAESIILASMFLVHSKSRRVSDRSMFIKKGIGILKKLKRESTGEDGYVASYNIGKAYQFFGFSGFAESFYMEALNSSDAELRRLAQFNLYIIYKKNNTKQLFKSIIDREND